MVFNTVSVGSAVAPTVIETYFSHYLNRKPLRQKPTAHISYHEGLSLIKQFLRYASFHTVEDVQGFTSQWVPTPRWVKVDEITVPDEPAKKSASAITAQLGHHGIDRIGGSKWWQWRMEGNVLKAEWIEMRSDYASRKRKGEMGKRVVLYVHGGAYFFGSVDEHRYQMQRHARKLNARVFARKSQCQDIAVASTKVTARYRLAPQFPFPCGLHDCLAAYLYLLTCQEPSEIILAGDSAGGGMVLSLLVILRDQGIPLPAGAVLISPWVDLTHSFPSLNSDSSYDYVPAHGFMQRPSAAWPPPNADDMANIALHAVEKVVGDDMPRKSTQQAREKVTEVAIQGFTVDQPPANMRSEENMDNQTNTIPGAGHDLSILIDGEMVKIKDQIQMYTTNQLISHPLVSPALQPSLGGLPPLLILTGGGEILRDEQIYLAHKAANPAQYPPGETYLNEYPEARELVAKWKPTDVQLQVWEDLCHVAPTLSFTRPAKYMYRSVAQFGAWVLARAQKTEIDILDDDDVSVISEGSENESGEDKPKQEASPAKDGVVQGQSVATEQKVGKAGDPLPAFENHMIRQRVDRHGYIYSLDPPSSLPALQMSPNEIGVIKPGPVKKWLNAKKEWDAKFAREKRRVQKQRAKDMAKGFQDWGDDDAPPPSALAARRGLHMPKEEKKGKSWGMSLWSLWGSSHDEKTIEREEKADKEPEKSTVTENDGANARPVNKNRPHGKSRSRLRHRAVTDTGQNADDALPTMEHGSEAHDIPDPTLLSPHSSPPTHIRHGRGSLDSAAVETSDSNRPTAGSVAFPFKFGTHLGADNASVVTLTSQAGVVTPKGNEVGKELEGGVQGSPLKNEVSTAVGQEEVKRSQVERFETAREEL